MWNRSIFKANAKIPLKTTYWTAFAVCLVISVIFWFTSSTDRISSSSGNSGNSGNSAGFDFLPNFNPPDILSDFSRSSIFSVALGIIIGASLILFVLGIAFTFFVQNPLTVGQARFFVYNRRYPSEFTTLFSTFKTNYLNIVATMAVQYILVFLWSLLFIIPGIIASYSYAAVPYILAENPNMPTGRALELSKAMTKGYKWEWFCLDLSFVGWQILGLLCCGVGILFLNPYFQSTYAEAYEFLKQNALSNGLCDISEFGM